jgi:hypothetical protein
VGAARVARLDPGVGHRGVEIVGRRVHPEGAEREVVVGADEGAGEHQHHSDHGGHQTGGDPAPGQLAHSV